MQLIFPSPNTVSPCSSSHSLRTSLQINTGPVTIFQPWHKLQQDPRFLSVILTKFPQSEETQIKSFSYFNQASSISGEETCCKALGWWTPFSRPNNSFPRQNAEELRVTCLATRVWIQYVQARTETVALSQVLGASHAALLRTKPKTHTLPKVRRGQNTRRDWQTIHVQ